jgi:integrase
MVRQRPKKPYPKFPLFPHASGQWAKTIKGKHYYFGAWENPQAAEAKFDRERDDLYAGRTPSNGEGLTLTKLVNHFLTNKQRMVDSGELGQDSFADYHRNCAKVLKVLGKNTHVENLRPTDFEKLRANFAKTHGPKTLEGDITCSRVLFNFADSTFDIRVRYGDSFNKPSRTVLRKHRNEQAPKMLEAAELQKIIRKSSPQLRAMIYLGLNCGLGNKDCATLRLSHIDLTKKWLSFPRPKTGIQRRCPLWTETVAALKASIKVRPKPKSESDRVFITKPGNTWDPKSVGDNPIGKEFTKVLKELKLHRAGLGFYTLRRVFQTIGDRALDKDAVRSIMGHAEDASDMGAVYNQEPVDDKRLQTVANFVRAWLTKKTR